MRNWIISTRKWVVGERLAGHSMMALVGLMSWTPTPFGSGWAGSNSGERVSRKASIAAWTSSGLGWVRAAATFGVLVELLLKTAKGAWSAAESALAAPIDFRFHRQIEGLPAGSEVQPGAIVAGGRGLDFDGKTLLFPRLKRGRVFRGLERRADLPGNGARCAADVFQFESCTGVRSRGHPPENHGRRHRPHDGRSSAGTRTGIAMENRRSPR